MPELKSPFPAPVANPLWQPRRPPDPERPRVRWREFLAGNLYANPVRDLLEVFVYHLSRPAPPPRNLFTGRAVGVIHFGAKTLKVRRDDEVEFSAPYAEIDLLRFHTSPQSGQVWPDGLTGRLTVEQEQGKYEVPYAASQTHLATVCRFLLTKRIPFKEYLDGGRVHLGKQRNYRQIQELKKKHGIVW